MWEDEQVNYLSGEKKNTNDGSNTTFYSQHYPIGDRDNNGFISGADVYAYTLDSAGTKTQIVTITMDDSVNGKFTLCQAPNGNVLYITYYSAPVDMETPNALVKLACMQLASALCYSRIDAGKVQSYRVGKIAVMKQSDAFKSFKSQYIDTVNKIRRKLFKADRGTETL